MRWLGRRQSENVEDRRGLPVGRLAVGGGVGTLVVLVVVTLLGGDPRSLLQGVAPPAADPAAGSRQVDPAAQPLRDFVAGVWAHHAEKMRKILEPGDVDEALGAASAVGDDRLQKQAQGYVVPDSFTHGTSAQRSRWFRLGLETGDLGRAKGLFELPEEQL